MIKIMGVYLAMIVNAGLVWTWDVRTVVHR